MSTTTPYSQVTPYNTMVPPNASKPSTATPAAIPGQTAGQTTANNALNNFSSANQLPSQASFNPTLLNPSSLAQIQPSYFNGAQVGPAAQYGGAQIGPTATVNPYAVQSITQGNSPDLSSQATIAQILQGFQPEQTQQQGQLNQQLAAAGLSGGPAVAAQNQLNTQMTQAIAPAIAQAIQNSQSNQLNQGQYSSTQLINALSGNAQATNSAQQAQAQLAQQAGLSNQSASNANQTLNAQLAQQAGLANTDTANTANTSNVGAYNQTQAANAAATNSAQQAYLQQLQQQWADQFAAFNSINDAGLGAQNTISAGSAQNFGTPSSSSNSFGSLASGLGSLYTPTKAAA